MLLRVSGICHFLEDNDATWTKMAAQPSQACGRIGIQESSGDHCVDLLVAENASSSNSASARRVSSRSGTPPCKVDRVRRTVDAYTARRPTNEAASNVDVADPAANIEHVHAGRQAGAPADIFSEVA